MNVNRVSPPSEDEEGISGRLRASVRPAFTFLGGAVIMAVLTIFAALAGIKVLAVLLALGTVAAIVAAYLRLQEAQVLVERRFADPLREVSEASRRLAGGDPSRIAELSVPSEWQDIAGALASLTNALESERNSRAEDRTAGNTRATSIRELLRVIQHVGASLDLEEVAGRLAEGMVKVGAFQRGTVWLIDPSGDRVIPLRQVGAAGSPALPIPRGQGDVGRAMSNAQPVVIRGNDGEGGLVIPLVRGLESVGAVELRGETRPLTPQVHDALETLANFGCTSLEAAQLHEEVELRSETDGLTKIFNRRKLDTDLKGEVARSLRYKRPLSLIMVDVDHFKAINDELGHQTGDEVLRSVAAIIGRRSRETDSAYRYGGEEFAVLLRETDLHSASEIAERLRNRISDGLHALVPGRPVTASLGVAAISGQVQAADELIEAADAALYQAKQTGRNRVVVSSFSDGQPAAAAAPAG